MSDDENGVTVTPPERCAIGISFGNSNSSIAHTVSDGKAGVIANEEGDRQIPSILSYIEGEEYHGTQAKVQLVRNSKNTIAYFRDFLGKSFDSIDPTPCHASAHPQKHESTIAFSVQDTESETPSTLTIAEVTTRHIRRLASSASDFLGKKVNAAVITVPTNFTDAQKEALDKASQEAGIEVLQFISEPVAAVLAYDARPETKLEDRTILVADLGGTRSDIAVIAQRGGMYSVLATAHDYEFAGTHLDQTLIDHFAKEFMKKNKTDPRENARSLAKLKLECEATKKALSLGGNATISIESLADGIDFSSNINRTRYELLASKIFAGFTRLIEGAIKKADRDILDIDQVILSGGTSHTPRLASALANLFPPTTTVLAPSTSPTAINPSELSARGASIQASLIQEYDLEDIEQSAHPMVTATPHLKHALGVLVVTDDVERGIFKTLMERETAVPARRTGVFAVPREGGDVLVKICEGIAGVRVKKVEKDGKKGKVNGNKGATVESEEDSDEDDNSEEEDQEIREKTFTPGTVLAEAAVKGVKKGGKVEVVLNVNGDLAIRVEVREVGGKGGVRGMVSGKAKENGSA